MSNFEIRELMTAEEMMISYPLMAQLNEGFTRIQFEEYLPDMLNHGYRMIAVFDNEKCIAVTGMWFITKVYTGKYVEVDNYIVDENYRSKGIGRLMLNWVLDEAKKLNCKVAMLDAYVHNHAGHKFYFREGFVIKGYHFIKQLD